MKRHRWWERDDCKRCALVFAQTLWPAFYYIGRGLGYHSGGGLSLVSLTVILYLLFKGQPAVE
jgi:hypothetical protein